MPRGKNEKTGLQLKRAGLADFTITKGDVLTPVAGFFGDITGTPPAVKAYRDPDPPNTSKTNPRRPGGTTFKGGSIDAVTIKKGKS